jgi:hypothetical protein
VNIRKTERVTYLRLGKGQWAGVIRREAYRLHSHELLTEQMGNTDVSWTVPHDDPLPKQSGVDQRIAPEEMRYSWVPSRGRVIG